MKQALRAVLAVVIGYVIGRIAAVPLFWMGLYAMRPLAYVVVMVVVWVLLPRFIPAMKDSATPKAQPGRKSGPPLQVREEGEWTVIDARSSPMPKRGPILAVLLPGIMGVFIMGMGSVMGGLLFWFVFSGLIFMALSNGNRKKRHGGMGPFAVSRDAVRLPDGTVIPRARCYRYATRNTEDGTVLFYGGVASPSVLANSAVLAGQQLRAATHQRMVGISWAVVVEHEGTFSWLAGGLTKELADAVLDEVAKERKSDAQLLAESRARVEAADQKARASYDRAMEALARESGQPKN